MKEPTQKNHILPTTAKNRRHEYKFKIGRYYTVF